MTDTKICKTCGQEKSLTDFYFYKKKNHYQRSCKSCENEKRKKRYWSLPEEERKQMFRDNNKRLTKSGWSRQYRLKTRFGISLEEYDSMFQEQKGSCAICGTSLNESGRKNFSVDHCHSTGKVRGLLCHKCNSGIGFLNDDVNLLEKAISYLKD